MRVIILIAIASGVACASSNTAPGAANTGIARVTSGQGAQAISTGAAPIAGASTVAAPLDKLWRALPAVYDSIAIPLSTLDAASRMAGNRGLQARRELGGVSLGKYLDCGYAQGRPSADFYDVNLSVVTQLRPEDSTHTTVITTVDAVARPVLFSGEYLHCGTRGLIESRISSLLEAAGRR
jgi:hypothetical protein